MEVCARIFQDRSCVLDASSGNKTHAAKTLDIDYTTLLAKLKKYGLVQ